MGKTHVQVAQNSSGTLIQVSNSTYYGIIVDYAIVGGGGQARFGTTRVIFDNSNVSLDETSTTDIGGSTSLVTFTATVGGGNVTLSLNNGASGYTVDCQAFVRVLARP